MPLMAEIVKRRLRFFEEGELLDARFPGSADRQRTGGFIKRGGDSDDDFLLFERGLRTAGVPCQAHMFQEQSGSGDRRNL